MVVNLLLLTGVLEACLVKGVFGTQVLSQGAIRSLSTEAAAGQTQAGGGEAGEGQGTIVSIDRAVRSEQSLTICNAYAYPQQGLSVYALSLQRMLTKGPMAYKECQDYTLPIQEGDQLDFRVGNLSVGIFRASGLPRAKTALLVIPHRREKGSLSAAFESHAFAELGTSQIVVIDAYRGKDVGKVKITDSPDKSTNSAEIRTRRARAEDLHFSSVVAVKPGRYQVMLADASDKSLATVGLEVGKERSKYIVIRTGSDSDGKKENQAMAAPQDLVVYAQNEAKSGAFAKAQPGIIAALAAAVMFFVVA